MSAYYNENDPKAAAWLRELIRAGHIADGVVDERSVEDVTPDDVRKFTQCHFFAGIGGWSYALRLAGWPDDRPVWTGSCPCQPFSGAGKRAGVADKRHLWPAFHWLIRHCDPAAVFGEQVASRDGRDWLATVRADMEDLGYGFGAADLCAAGVGAAHIRQRLYFVAYPSGERRQQEPGGAFGNETSDGGTRRERLESDGDHLAAGNGEDDGAWTVGHTHHPGPQGRRERRDGSDQRPARSTGLDGFWAASEWVACRDGKARPVEPGTFPLAHGIPARVGRLRGYGNAIVPQVAATFIAAAERTVEDLYRVAAQQ